MSEAKSQRTGPPYQPCNLSQHEPGSAWLCSVHKQGSHLCAQFFFLQLQFALHAEHALTDKVEDWKAKYEGQIGMNDVVTRERYDYERQALTAKREVERLMGLMGEIRKNNDGLKATLPELGKEIKGLIEDKVQLLERVRDQRSMIETQRRTIADYQAGRKP